MSVSKVQFDGNTLINLENDTVTANKMLSGTKAHDKNGDSITGNIASKASATYTPTTTDQMIAAGQYLAGAQTIKGDANLVAGNIKKDVTIFGKTGTYEGGGGDGLPELPAPSTWSSNDFILDKDYQISKPTEDTIWNLPRDYRIIIPSGRRLIVQSYEIEEFENYGQIILNGADSAFTCYPLYFAATYTGALGITSPDGIISTVTLYDTENLYLSGKSLSVIINGTSNNLSRLECGHLDLYSDIYANDAAEIIVAEISVVASSTIYTASTISCAALYLGNYMFKLDTNFEVSDALFVSSNTKINLANGYSFTYSGDAADIYTEAEEPFIFNFGGTVTGIPSQYIADVGVKTPLSITENGTYTAPAGVAYSPVTVNVSGGGIPEPVPSDVTVVVPRARSTSINHSSNGSTWLDIDTTQQGGSTQVYTNQRCIGIRSYSGASITPLDGARQMLHIPWAFGAPVGIWYIYKNCTFTITTECFLPDTLITLADGSTKQAKDITYNDKLKVWDFDKGEFGEANICWLTKTGMKNNHYYKLTFSDGTVCKFTGDRSNHKIYYVDRKEFYGVAYAEIGDRIFSENGIVTVTNKEYIEEECEYYNLITTGNINCFCNGILSSDRYGNMYPIDEDMKYIKGDRPIRPYSEFEPHHIKKYWYDTLRLGELTDSIDDVVNYIGKLECQMLPLPTNE